MKSTEVRQGRTFVLRLEHGEIIHETVEKFAYDNDIQAAHVSIVGGADKGSILVVGPEQGSVPPFKPMELTLDESYEITGVGAVFPDESGAPLLHMHIACGRKNHALCGCVRKGVKIWLVAEVIIQELTDCEAMRRMDERSGFKLLEI
jgi:predicted DNA-binding protein with PD1-like motif